MGMYSGRLLNLIVEPICFKVNPSRLAHFKNISA